MADTSMWPDEIYRILRDWDVTQFSYVPDAGHAVLINRSLEDPEVHSVALTTEEEGVAMLAGAGVAVEYTCHPGMIHHFYALAGAIPYARTAIEQVGAAIKRALA